jgi:hypothetical protein
MSNLVKLHGPDAVHGLNVSLPRIPVVGDKITDRLVTYRVVEVDFRRAADGINFTTFVELEEDLP